MATRKKAAAPPTPPPPRTLFEKIWDAHVVDRQDDGTCVIYIDRHLVHEVTSPQAFEGLRMAGRRIRRPDATIAVADHNTPTTDFSAGITDDESRIQVETLEKNVVDFGVPYFGLDDPRRGIVHVIGPEQGLTLPGMTIVCGDSHTSTHGAFGALAFGIGTSEVGHVLATQCLLQRKARTMSITVDGELAPGVGAKDVVLHIIGVIGVNGGTGHVLEFRGSTIAAMDMEQRMTLCNMSIEAGARAGMVAPDQTTFDWVARTPRGPKGADFDKAVAYWKTLRSDDGARFDVEVRIDAADIRPTLTWGTHPGTAIAVDAPIPAANDAAAQKGLDYMKFEAGHALAGTPVDVVFVGSCTNGRLSDMREVAQVLRGRRVAAGVRMLVVPGSEIVKRDAEAEGIHDIVRAAGAEWREPGCSMCIAMNGDLVAPGQLAVSTSNRNFEGRQGPGSRTLLASPLSAAWAAVNGKVADVRELFDQEVA